jgi:hypothetical protein
MVALEGGFIVFEINKLPIPINYGVLKVKVKTIFKREKLWEIVHFEYDASCNANNAYSEIVVEFSNRL